jgi:hypothetical protein
MWIGDQLIEADVVEKQRAREIYETILRERRDPGLLEMLDRLVEPDTRGDPQSPLRWTCKSTRILAAELRTRVLGSWDRDQGTVTFLLEARAIHSGDRGR